MEEFESTLDLRGAGTRAPGPLRAAGRARSKPVLQPKASALALALALPSIPSCSIPRWPVDGPLTSPYGVRVRGWLPEIHRGVDVYVPEGTPVTAMKDGTVVFAGAWGSYGLAVVLQHGGGVRTVYAHLSGIDVSAGQRVRGRQVIGRSGRTGNATGPHLHFEVLRNGWAVDPVPLLGGRPAETRQGSAP